MKNYDYHHLLNDHDRKDNACTISLSMPTKISYIFGNIRNHCKEKMEFKDRNADRNVWEEGLGEASDSWFSIILSHHVPRGDPHPPQIIHNFQPLVIANKSFLGQFNLR